MKRMFKSIGMPVFVIVAGTALVFLIDQYYTLNPLEAFLVFAGVFCILISLKNHWAQERFFNRVKSEMDGVASYEKDIHKRLGEIETIAKDTTLLTEVANRVDECEHRLTQHATLISSAQQSENEPEDDPAWAQRSKKVVSLASVAQKREQVKQSKLKIPSDIGKAIEDGLLCMHLQPALYLLDRTVNDYEALARLDLGEGNFAQASQFISRAEKNGSIAEIDQEILFKIIKLIRQLDRNDIHPNLFWNLSGFSIKSDVAFNEIENTLNANSAICGQITAEISQHDYRELTSKSLRKLSTLRELGLRLSIDNCTDIELACNVAKSGLFADIKIPTPSLIGYTEQSTELIGREISEVAVDHDVRVIATHVEREFQVMELIDQDILFGQGNLFSEPKPARTQPPQETAANAN